MNETIRKKKQGGRSVDIARAKTIEKHRRRRGLRIYKDIP